MKERLHEAPDGTTLELCSDPLTGRAFMVLLTPPEGEPIPLSLQSARFLCEYEHLRRMLKAV